ncbi:unnamed protein product [Ambrosiozyma monospora]|uniref:Unnamed protein product n=1 Tax=Ambrosiozyma monospora TaxID=43982 RepID=A0ACB5SV65_AMBMO|nr:unnamed protein product [Ambrosiozyma monospora]
MKSLIVSSHKINKDSSSTEASTIIYKDFNNSLPSKPPTSYSSSISRRHLIESIINTPVSFLAYRAKLMKDHDSLGYIVIFALEPSSPSISAVDRFHILQAIELEKKRNQYLDFFWRYHN